MAKKLFVGGLSWGTVDASLRQAFEQFGDVSDAKVIMDRETGRSRGFGFVTMPDDAEATKAITAMDGAAIDGRAVKVSEAQERAPRAGGFGGGGGGGGGYGGGGNGGGYGGAPRPSGDREYGNRDFGGGGGGGAAPGGFGGGGRDFGGGGGRDFGGGNPSGGARGDRGGRGRDRDSGGGGGRDW
jgi:RNA recognition motif-containing protein